MWRPTKSRRRSAVVDYALLCNNASDINEWKVISNDDRMISLISITMRKLLLNYLWLLQQLLLPLQLLLLLLPLHRQLLVYVAIAFRLCQLRVYCHLFPSLLWNCSNLYVRLIYVLVLLLTLLLLCHALFLFNGWALICHVLHLPLPQFFLEELERFLEILMIFFELSSHKNGLSF